MTVGPCLLECLSTVSERFDINLQRYTEISWAIILFSSFERPLRSEKWTEYTASSPDKGPEPKREFRSFSIEAFADLNSATPTACATDGPFPTFFSWKVDVVSDTALMKC
jgi:hypothetical protein